jgi:hypothetical protein
MARSCGSVQNYFRQVDLYPDLRRNQARLEALTKSTLGEGATAERDYPRHIPVVVHVLYKKDEDNISDEQVASQIKVLNEDYSASNTDIDGVPAPLQALLGNPGLDFFRAPVDPDGAPTNGITRTKTTQGSFSVDDSMKSEATGGKSPWDTSRYLNIWVCQMGGGILGYAQFPGGDPTTAFGLNGSADAPFNLGRTATHEVGHYLNLSHIWGEARVTTCEDSDFVDDTPNQFGPNTGKPRFPKSSCGNTPHGDMFMNYMDYVDDDTMIMFSQQQAARMQAALELSRSTLGAGLSTPAGSIADAS